jgi:hypothetical protein
MDATQTLAVRRVSSSADLLKPGDYCFIPKREPIRTFETVTAERPKGFWRGLLWYISGAKTTAKITELPQWPDYDAIVMACPHCCQPIGTTKEHTIVSVEPLTLDKPIGCAYSRQGFNTPPTITFQIKDGNIMPA